MTLVAWLFHHVVPEVEQIQQVQVPFDHSQFLGILLSLLSLVSSWKGHLDYHKFYESYPILNYLDSLSHHILFYPFLSYHYRL